MRDISSGRALVTGASSGIGAAIVRRLRADGRPVTALARRRERLDALREETGCDVVALDLRDADGIDAAVREIAPLVVINNAGSGQGYDGLEGTSGEDIATAVATNVVAPLRLLRAALPLMRERGGHVVNIGSIAGLYPINNALYAATKGAVHSMSQNLRVELSGSGVRVTEIAPGRTESEFYDAAGLSPEKAERFKKLAITVLAPDDVAEAVVWALAQPPHVNVSLIELVPTEQALGGAIVAPFEDAGEGTGA